MPPVEADRVISSVGRASPLHGEGRRFKPVITHQLQQELARYNRFCGPVVQLVRMPACHAGGREFESRPVRHLANKNNHRKVVFLCLSFLTTFYLNRYPNSPRVH
jgi:hypothetical protein